MKEGIRTAEISIIPEHESELVRKIAQFVPNEGFVIRSNLYNKEFIPILLKLKKNPNVTHKLKFLSVCDQLLSYVEHRRTNNGARLASHQLYKFEEFKRYIEELHQAWVSSGIREIPKEGFGIFPDSKRDEDVEGGEE